MLLPLIVRWSIDVGFPCLTVIFTFFICVFMLISTPTIVPCTTVPFFSSITSVSFARRMRKRTSFIFNEVKK